MKAQCLGSVHLLAPMSASGALTQERLAWQPKGPGLIADLEQVR
jgi:hypothetical protein